VKENHPELALFQPDMAANVGAAIRLCACLGVPLHLIEPFGFPWDIKKVRQAALDYIDLIEIQRHSSWERFTASLNVNNRLILLTTKAAQDYCEVAYQPGDILLMGRESAGVPEPVHARADLRVKIPMHGPARSLNVVTAAAMVLGEALRQGEYNGRKTKSIS
jgi:tRNA (cytidine/uridine-2'-O-)-methyltransferase